MTGRKLPTYALAAATLAALLTSCGRDSTQSPAAALTPGWNEIVSAPYSADLQHPLTFWAGEELIVAGGYEFPSPSESVTFKTETWAYSSETQAWRELASLSVPGFDGMAAFAGAWTGQEWIGVARLCPNGEVVDEVPSNSCERMPVGLRWDLADGWALTEAVPGEAINDESNAIVPAGTTSTKLILATITGYLTYDLRAGGWSFLPWPDGAEPVTVGSACVLGEDILTVSSVVSGVGGLEQWSYPQSITANTITLDGALAQRRPLADLEYLSFPPYCQPGRAMFVYTNLGEPVLRVTNEEISPLPVVTRYDTGEPAISVLPEWIDVGTGVLYPSNIPTESYYVDTNLGELTVMADSLNPELAVWSGQVLFVSPALSNRWFAFLPDGTWQQSAELPFTFEIESN